MLDAIEDRFVMAKLRFPLRESEISGVASLMSVAANLYEGEQEDITIESPELAQTSISLETDLDKVRKLLTPADGTRYVFFTGKGGVGKSTIACATSVYLAKHGFKTLIVTTDPASHLQGIFEQEIDPEPTPIIGIEGLKAVRIDQKKALEEYRARIMASVADQADDVRRSVEEDLNSPCAEEMSAFEKFMSYLSVRDYDVVIFDTAPTGHTLRLLELPSDWKGFIDLGTLTKRTSDQTMRKYADVIGTMRNPGKSTFVFVVYPEYTPIIEAWRASQELEKQVGIGTSLVGVNYMLPEEYGRNAFFRMRRRQQEKYLAEIERSSRRRCS